MPGLYVCLSASCASPLHHQGHAAKSFLPTERGFSSFYGYLTDQIDYYDKTYPYTIEGGYYKDFFYAEPGRLQVR